MQYNIEDQLDQSVKLTVEKIRHSSNAILFFKDSGMEDVNFSKDEFILIVQAESQKESLLNNQSIVSVDSTHDSSIKGLLLTTIMCRDKMR